MKSVTVLFGSVLFLLFALISCSSDDKESYQDKANQYVDKIKVNQVLSMKGQSQIIAYKMLGAQEKLFLWNTKLENILETEELNNTQKIFIQELKFTLDVKHFERSVIKDKKYLQFLSKMKIIGMKILGPKRMVNYFSSITQNSDLPYQTSSIHCSCNSGDDWCITGRCFHWACDTADGGCGWWGQQVCNGFCARNDLSPPGPKQ